MKINLLRNSKEIGREAAELSAKIMNESIALKGKARIVLSTGASQFDTLEALVQQKVDWGKVEMFHLDEYVNLPEHHPASFRKYLKERFIDLIPSLHKAHLVSGEGDIEKNIAELTEEIRKEPIDLALIGIGENAHIAFNDPPADFDTQESFIIVKLDEDCKKQQVNEGWFAAINDVPTQAITMTVHQIMQSKAIVSCVPYQAKAKAIKAFIENDATNLIPATILKTHPDLTVFLDEQSSSEADPNLLKQLANR
ncbi:glucosamine-6-phosphate deaminase [Ammoniphilus sp. YIM 78166]|uniref:glucosamine-6-phosphate deaminase n=1 Tax=Ammoniphilus sp. YIM 78166 TaxID=1644106 RepID=UPI00106FF978|nr:glucosamine-6-phosphate deaminase [Ammoniphilus sp. YIM 78166]